MENKKVKNVVIVGGGTAGWMAAASLSKLLFDKNITITLIESSTIGTVGVGEATLPSLREFNRYLGIDEIDFIRATQATFKLGIEFKDWYKPQHSFFHPFGNYGTAIANTDFHHYWHRARSEGDTTPLSDYCLPTLLAKKNRFSQPDFTLGNPLAEYNYAFHFDALAYANLLREYAEKRGVTRIDDKVIDVQLSQNDGSINSVMLSSKQIVSGDFFIDCSGFQGLLIEGALKTGYEDWRHWLPCDGAVAVSCEITEEPTPYTQSIAMNAGWRWRIPLQNRIGNGYVYSSQFIDKNKAEDDLISALDGRPLSQPNHLHFVTGKRKKTWNKNCFSLGLSAGFLEPLESTSIAFIQNGIGLIHQYFPYDGFEPAEINEVNRHTQLDFERARDFLILHYMATKREKGKLWEYCRNMNIPDSLSHKVDLYKARAHIINYERETFEKSSWLSLYEGMNILPKAYDNKADLIPYPDLKKHLQKMHNALINGVSYASTHANFIKKHCATKY